MKVSRVTSYVVNPGVSKNWVFAKVETDEGLYGWGEAYTQTDRDEGIRATIDALGRYLVGRDPFEIKSFLLSAHADFAIRRGSMELYSARSAIEQALWDIAGKATGQPVYNLLGGRCRESIHVYANGWSSSTRDPEELGQQAKNTVSLGFDALKFDPFPGPWRDRLSPADIDTAVAHVRAVRDAVGPDVDLLIEAHRRFEPSTAIKIGRRLAEYDPFWYEEPVDAENLEALAEVRAALDTPIVTGETLYTKAEFAEVFGHRAADILNPDVCCCGILETREIAAMAEAYRVHLSPHNYNSDTMGLASTLQVAAAVPDLVIVEYFVSFTKPSSEVTTTPFEVHDGRIALPTVPGLGLELDEAALEERPGKVFPMRRLPALYRQS